MSDGTRQLTLRLSEETFLRLKTYALISALAAEPNIPRAFLASVVSAIDNEFSILYLTQQDEQEFVTPAARDGQSGGSAGGEHGREATQAGA